MDIGLIGFGGVGQALAGLLIEKKKYLREKYNLEINLKYIINSSGGIYNPEKIDLIHLINHIQKGKQISEYKDWGNYNIDSIIANGDVDTIVELTHTNISSGQPALMHMEKALKNRMNVVTGNKGPIFLKYKYLNELAGENGVQLMVGCTTGGALPSINGGLIEVAGSEITSMEGILNGTTNYILSEMMKNHISYDEALKQAQKEGIAEKNPTLDIEGYDTAVKIIILSNVILNTDLSLNDIKVEGISHIKKEELIVLKEQEKKLKLMGKVAMKNGKATAEVKLCEIDKSHPLYLVDGKNKGITYKTDSLGEISIIGGASGRINAAAAILRDLINLK